MALVNIEFRGAVYPVLYRPGDNPSSILRQVAPGEGFADQGTTSLTRTPGRRRLRVVALRGPTQWLSGDPPYHKDDPPIFRIEDW